MHPHVLNCPVHHSEQIQLVCMTCPSNSLACPLCLDISHTMHEVISLKKFMSHEVARLYNEKPNLQRLQKDIDGFISLFKNYMEKMRKQVGYELNQLEAYFQEKADRFKQEVMFVCGQSEIKNLSPNVEAAKLMIKNNKKIPNHEDFDQKLKQIENKMNQAVNDACLEIRRIIFKLKKLFDQSSDILLNSKAFSRFEFSPVQKHQSVEIKNQGSISINKHFDNLYHSCVVIPPLCPYHPEITFEIKKSDHKCIWLGIASLEALTKTNYQNSYKSDGPNYWIWQAGGDEQAEIYSQNSQNRPLVGWNFEVGDKITLSIVYQESGNKKLEIVKNNRHEQKFIIPINEKVGAYYACISLGDEEESVAIINKQY